MKRRRRWISDHHKAALSLVGLYIVMFLFYTLVVLVCVVLPLGLIIWAFVEIILFIMRH